MEIKKSYLEQSLYFVLVAIIAYFIIGSFINSTYSLVVIDNPDPNSLYPTYQQGDLFVIHKLDPESYQLGDVVVYENDNGKNIIHRIIDIIDNNGNYYFRVKGDNPLSNYAPDSVSGSTLISNDRVLGKIALRVALIGHISLSVQQNAGLRYILIAAAIIFSLALIFYPEEEKEDEEEMLKINADLLRSFIHYPLERIQHYKETGKFRALLVISILTAALFLTPIIMPSILYDNKEPVVYDLEISNLDFLNDTIGGQHYNSVFIQVWVYFEDYGSFFEKLESFTILASLTESFDAIIGETAWNTKRHMYGSATVGGSMIIDEQDLPASGDTIYLKVIYTIDKLFKDLENDYAESFVLDY